MTIDCQNTKYCRQPMYTFTSKGSLYFFHVQEIDHFR